MNTHQHPAAEGWRLVQAEAPRHGWKWPSLRTVQRWFAEEVPEPQKVYARKGPRQFQATCIPAINCEFNMPAGSHWVGDEMLHNFPVRVPDAARGWRLVRPILTAFIDKRSRVFVGWDMGERGNSDTILSAFKTGALSYGLPSEITIDNGRDYRSVGGGRRQWSDFDELRIGGAFEQSGILTHYAIPYWAWSKLIEPAFGVVQAGFDQHQPGWLGRFPDERPADWKERAGNMMDHPTLDEARQLFATWLQSYHATIHSGLGGLTPNLVMERERGEIRKCDPAVLDVLCCRVVGPVKVGRDGVRHNGVTYGQANEQVFLLQGKKVWLRVRPDRADSVTVCDDQGVPICVATNERLKGATQEDLRKAMEYKGRLRKKVREAQAGAVDLLFSKPDQVMELKRRAAKAAEAKLREQLPAVAEAPAVTIVRPDLHEAAKKLAKQNGFDRLAAKAAAEGRNAVGLPRESVGAALARVFTEKAAPGPAKDVQTPDWAAYARQCEADAGREAALA